MSWGDRIRLTALSLVGAVTVATAQEAHEEAHKEHERHELAVLIAHSHVGQGLNAEGGRSWLVLPAWEVNYNYWLNDHWALGLHTDLINENFVVEEFGEGAILERERPVAPAIVVTHRPHHHWAFLLGGGMEFAPSENLALARGGVEYTVHLGEGWETGAGLTYDLRIDAYDSWTLGIGVSRRF